MFLSQLLTNLEKLAPLATAEKWDNVGLLLGGPLSAAEFPITRVMTCLTLTEDVAEEAVAERADLIVTHHPILFKPVQRFTEAVVEQRIVMRLIRSGIAVYSAHTAYDNAATGINQQLAEGLGLEKVRPLRPFASPLIGGAGRVGEWGSAISLATACERVQNLLSISSVSYVGAADRPVQTVALACGSAGEFLDDARRTGCDLFITGETRFHGALEARSSGVALILTGHYASERSGMEQMARQLNEMFPSLVVWASRNESDPFVSAPGATERLGESLKHE